MSLVSYFYHLMNTFFKKKYIYIYTYIIKTLEYLILMVMELGGSLVISEKSLSNFLRSSFSFPWHVCDAEVEP